MPGSDDDDDRDEWFGQTFVIPIRRSIVRSLLAGNDSCCFTTEQYEKAYEKTVNDMCKTSAPVNWDWVPGGARMHLNSTELVREVSPDVWTYVEEQQS
jgi:hypothetical protein